MIDVLIQSLCFSLFCMGLWTITDEGQLLSFLRAWTREWYDEQDKVEERIRAGFSYDKRKYNRRKLILYACRPIIGCVVCYSSFWTIVLHTALYGFEYIYIPVIIMHMFIVAYLNSIFLDLYDR